MLTARPQHPAQQRRCELARIPAPLNGGTSRNDDGRGPGRHRSVICLLARWSAAQQPARKRSPHHLVLQAARQSAFGRNPIDFGPRGAPGSQHDRRSRTARFVRTPSAWLPPSGLAGSAAERNRAGQAAAPRPARCDRSLRESADSHLSVMPHSCASCAPICHATDQAAGSSALDLDPFARMSSSGANARLFLLLALTNQLLAVTNRSSHASPPPRVRPTRSLPFEAHQVIAPFVGNRVRAAGREVRPPTAVAPSPFRIVRPSGRC